MSLQGSLDARGHPRLPVVLRGPFGSTTVSAIVDTGFVSAISTPSSFAPRMGLLRRDVRPTLLADGSMSVVRIFLIGVGLLRGHVLSVDYGATRSVEIR